MCRGRFLSAPLLWAVAGCSHSCRQQLQLGTSRVGACGLGKLDSETDWMTRDDLLYDYGIDHCWDDNTFCIARPVHYSIVPNGAPHMAGTRPEAVKTGPWVPDGVSDCFMFRIVFTRLTAFFCFLVRKVRCALRHNHQPCTQAPSSANKYGCGSYTPSSLAVFLSFKASS